MRIRRGLWRKLLTLTAAEWAELLWAQWTLVQVQLLLWTRARARISAPANEALGAVGDGREVAAELRRIQLAVERAAEYGLYRPSCLVRSLALHRMLGFRGVSGSAVRLGARLEHGRFTAHAWVEYRGRVLGDHDWHVKQFAALAQMEVDGPP